MGQTIEAIVDGGQASAGPPLGPALGPAGVNIGEVIKAINEKTASYKGMKVPVAVEIDDKKNFTITVGTPPASALIKQKIGLQKGTDNAKSNFVGDISIDQIKEIVEMKGGDLLGGPLPRRCNEIVGTCVSMGVTVEGIDAREASRKIRSGEWDAKF